VDQRNRDLDRQIAAEGWTKENANKWIVTKTRTNPQSAPRKSLKGRPYSYKGLLFDTNGKPSQYVFNPSGSGTMKPFEFNDVIQFIRVRKVRNSLYAHFKSYKYDCDVLMHVVDFNNAAPFMSRGILAGRFVWKFSLNRLRTCVKFLEEL